LNERRAIGMVCGVTAWNDEFRRQGDRMADTFLKQLEQRTQQVKITLANLEAEKVRIEGLIARLQPIVPHYDALVAAERTLVEAQLPLDEAAPAPAEPEVPATYQSGWQTSQPEQPSSSWQ
jgi:hypothetical protein